MSFELTASLLKAPGIKGANKLVLLGYADAASNDGTGAWLGAEALGQIAGVGSRQVERARKWLVDNGYLREGAQDHPNLLRIRRDLRPISYDVATTEETRLAWKRERAEGRTDIRDHFAAAGQKGALIAQASKVPALTPREGNDAPSNVVNPGLRPVKDVDSAPSPMSAKPTHATATQWQINPMDALDDSRTLSDGNLWDRSLAFRTDSLATVVSDSATSQGDVGTDEGQLSALGSTVPPGTRKHAELALIRLAIYGGEAAKGKLDTAWVPLFSTRLHQALFAAALKARSDGYLLVGQIQAVISSYLRKASFTFSDAEVGSVYESAYSVAAETGQADHYGQLLQSDTAEGGQ